jgi:ribosome-binding protein aMBF1 (putative translation factor)
MVAQHVGHVIRSARQVRGWSQIQLHVHSRVGLADISRIETGRLAPTGAQLKRLGAALGLTDLELGLAKAEDRQPSIPRAPEHEARSLDVNGMITSANRAASE